MLKQKLWSLARDFRKEITAAISAGIAAIFSWIFGLPEKWRWGLIGFALGVFGTLIVLRVVRWVKHRPTVSLQNCADKYSVVRRLIGEMVEKKQGDAWRIIGCFWLHVHIKA